MAQDALRVLGMAARDLPEGAALTEEGVDQGMVFLGLAGMMDPPRPEAIEAIRTCKQVHIKPVMITGDHKLTALAGGTTTRQLPPGTARCWFSSATPDGNRTSSTDPEATDR